ncbi:MAG: hypothetical protein Fur0015_12140 [Ignavibacteriales bacterium]
MKIKLLVLIFMFSTFAFGQMHQKMKDGNRLERLEKIKLIEELNLNEETSARLVSRLSENRQKQKEFMKKKMKLISEIENDISTDEKKDNKFYESRINSLIEIEREMHNQREDFIKSLSDILTPEQILKTMIFEVKFREEVKDALIRKERR